MDARRVTLPVHWVGTIFLVLIGGTGSYFKAMTDIQSEFARERLDREMNFVRKDDMKLIRDKLETIAEDVASIKGNLRPRQRPDGQ
jgi:tRNA A37 N6-isopentenylltransferase MiaA